MSNFQWIDRKGAIAQASMLMSARNYTKQEALQELLGCFGNNVDKYAKNVEWISTEKRIKFYRDVDKYQRGE